MERTMPSEFVQQLDDMARDFADILHGGHHSFDGHSAKLHAVETLSVRKSDRFTSGGPSIRREKSNTPAGFFMTALSMVAAPFQRLRSGSHLKQLNFSFRTLAFIAAPIVVAAATLAWQSHGVSKTKPANADVAAGQTVSTLAGRMPAQNPVLQSASVAQTERTATVATAPALAQELGNLVRDLAVLRDNVEQLAAKQEQTAQNVAGLQAVATKQQQTDRALQELAAKQEQLGQTLQELAAKQEQMARAIAMLPTEAETDPADEDMKPSEDTRPRLSSPSSARAAPLPRPKRVITAVPKQSTTQSASAPLPAPVHLPFLDASH
jgi:hypothetical protein